MPYYTHYTANFTNERNQLVAVTIQRKDTPASAQQRFPVTKLEINSDSSEGTIIASELLIGLWIEDGSEVTWETFLVSNYDEWYVIVEIDGNRHFEGFLMPEEGSTDFQSRPYEITMRASNALKLLKQVSLTDLNGDEFDGTVSLIEYVAACLQKYR